MSGPLCPARLDPAWADGALARSELRYRRLFETARDGILILDADTAEIVDVNPFVCELLALSRGEIVGKPIWGIGPLGDVPASRAMFAELNDREYVRYEHLPLEAADGRAVDVEFVSNLYEVDGGKVIQCNVRDVTERKRTERERARLSRAVEQSAESILITDTDGVIVYVNPAFERLSGYSSLEALGRNARFLKSGHHDAAYYERLWDALRRGDVWSGQLVNRRKDGSSLEHEATIAPVRDAAGRVLNYVAVLRDVSTERLLERRLLQAQKMEAVGRLAGGVAHDFNNLLGVITGYGTLALKALAAEHTVHAKLVHILKAADRAAGLTRQLLAFTRQQVLQPVVLDLNAAVREVTTMLQRIIGEDVELVTWLDDGLGRVRADRVQVEQSIVNLVANARDAMPEGGRVTLQTRNVALDATTQATHPGAAPGRYVLLAVSDDGIGMDAEAQARAFEPFYTTKPVGKGTGLGLSTVYGIVEQSRGYLWLRSEPGQGTTFEMCFPRVDEPLTPAPDEQPVPPPRAGVRILLIEDEAMLRDMTRETLERGGYAVLAACDGADAVRVADAHAGPIDLILTDVVMPGASGPRAVERLVPTHPRAKVLYVSGYSKEAVMPQVAAGTAFLAKPFAPDALLRTVRELLESP